MSPASVSAPVAAPPRRAVDVLRSYLALTKTRIIEQLLVVTVPAMFLAERRWQGGTLPSAWLVVAVLVGGAMAAASAHALNCVLDADIDALMKRTRRRPLVRDEVPRVHALVFGLVLGAASAVWLGLTTNWLAAGLSVAAIAFYVLVYTLLLKRRTSQNIVWGGAAGCMPVVIGWAAVTGTVEWPALVMFGVIFFWTPPHFWALAMRYRDDYAAAGVPMLPVVAGNKVTRRQILLYTLPMVAAAIAPWAMGLAGWIYGIVAVALNAIFLWLAVAVSINTASEPAAMAPEKRLFKYSILYLFILFGALVADRLVLA